MSVGALVNAAGANFVLLVPEDTQIKSAKPVISVGAVRTGCGKSQTSRRILEILMVRGLKVVAIRHPMPYGDIAPQKLQRFDTFSILRSMTAPWKRWKNTNPTGCGAMLFTPVWTTRPSSGRRKMTPTAEL